MLNMRSVNLCRVFGGGLCPFEIENNRFVFFFSANS